MGAPLAYMLIAEAGDLERKALLLVESIRAFGGRYREAPVWVVQPRAGGRLSARTSTRLAGLGAVFLRAELNTTWRDYPLANKPYAAALVEELLEGSIDTLALLDSDTLVLRSPDELVLRPGETVAVRPVDEMLVGAPATEPAGAFWEMLYDTCGVASEAAWTVTTTVDRQAIRAYFNSGLVAVRPGAGLFRRWRDNVERLAARRHDGAFLRTPQERWFLEQACFAATVLATTPRSAVRLLGVAYNYPLHKQSVLPDDARLDRLDQIAVLHYHRAFHGLSWMRGIEVGSPYAAWLRERLPLPGVRARLAQWPPARRLAGRVRAISRLSYAWRTRYARPSHAL